MMDGISGIRVATDDDVAPVLELWQRAGTVPSVTDGVAALRRLIESQPGSLIVAERDAELVGALIAAWDGWRGNMYRLAVLPRYRRLGIGRRLVAAGEDFLRGRGARRITALVMGGHDDAVELWTACGYSPDPRMSRHVKTLTQ